MPSIAPDKSGLHSRLDFQEIAIDRREAVPFSIRTNPELHREYDPVIIFLDCFNCGFNRIADKRARRDRGFICARL
jgi:hypothetical protein